MIIPNHKDAYKAVAEKYDLDPELVEKIGSFTWADLNERISEFKNREIYVYKLGTWKFRKVKGEQYLTNLRKELTRINKNPRTSEKEKNKLIDKIGKISLLLKEWDQIIEERQQFKYEQTKRSI